MTPATGTPRPAEPLTPNTTEPATGLPSPDEAIAAIEKAWNVVSALCAGKQRWTMSIPAEPDRDPDLVIGHALSLAKRLISVAGASRGEAPPARIDVDRLREAIRDVLDPNDPPETQIRTLLDNLDELAGEYNRLEWNRIANVPEHLAALRQALRAIVDLPTVVPDHAHGGVHPPYLEWARVSTIALTALEAAAGGAPPSPQTPSPLLAALEGVYFAALNVIENNYRPGSDLPLDDRRWSGLVSAVNVAQEQMPARRTLDLRESGAAR